MKNGLFIIKAYTLLLGALATVGFGIAIVNAILFFSQTIW
jgi:hypothetical protein